MLTIDGSMGEGGGQVLRSSLTMSTLTGKPFHIKNIRAGRKKPGLMRQHLTAVLAASEVSSAKVDGAEIGATRLDFIPGSINAGDYRFTIATAGSCTLVFQTILPALLTAAKPSILHLEGGTHNPLAPPYDFLQKSFVPILCRMGAGIKTTLLRPGFYPAGGGYFRVEIEPVQELKPIELHDRGNALSFTAKAYISRLHENIARRELGVVEKKLGWDINSLEVVTVTNSRGPGNILSLELEYEHVTEICTGFGSRGVPAEKVAAVAVKEAKRYINSTMPVGRFLADQLLIPFSMAGGGSFNTLPLSRHTRTNIEVIAKFSELPIHVDEYEKNRWRVLFGNGG
ncbi:RNA 3'-terminal phosphate cyclase [Candidatus Riflebacteria bacterium]